jgi:hypothetical protein
MADTARLTTRATWGRWAALVAFGAGFGYVEAAVVHYLRRILGNQLPDQVHAAHTYLNVGFIAFTVWDLTYYLFLRVLDGWPASVMDRDVFFLIPVAWVGPVLTALVLSTLVLAAASAVYLRAPGAEPAGAVEHQVPKH